METLLRAGSSNAVAAAMMAMLVMILSRPLARRPAIVHGLWLLVLIKLVTPPFYEIPIPWPSPALVAPEDDTSRLIVVQEEAAGDAFADRFESPGFAADVAPPAGPGPAEIRTVTPPPTIRRPGLSTGIAVAWLAGSAAVGLLSLRRIVRFHRLLKQSRSATVLEQDRVDEWAATLGLRRPPALGWVPGPISPLIWFVGTRPRLIVPHDLWKRLDDRQQSTLIVHELAHLRRGDHLVRLLETAVAALFWWHPLVWWMRGPLREVEEQCCDAWVIWALPDAVRAYAETLLDTLDFLQQARRPEPLLASGLGQVPHLKRRLTMIMSGTSRRLPGLPGRLGLFAAAAILLPIGASWAQKADEKPAGKFVEFWDGRLEAFNQVEIQTFHPVASGTGSKESQIVLRLDGDSGQGVLVTGSLDEVIQKLEAIVSDMMHDGKPAPGAKEYVDALEKALQTLKGVKNIPASGKASTTPQPGETRGGYRFVVRTAPPPAPPSAEKAAEAARTREEIVGLKKDLEGKLEKIRKAQAKLRELGEDPGATPFLGWNHPVADPRGGVTRRYTVVRPKEGAPVEHTYTVVRPKAAGPRVIEDDVALPVRTVPPASEKERLDRLEKRLKEVQDELSQLKKGSGPGGGK